MKKPTDASFEAQDSQVLARFGLAFLVTLALGLVPTCGTPASAFAQAKTKMTLASDKNPAIAGEYVALTAHLVWSAPPAHQDGGQGPSTPIAPTGVIQIKEGTQVLAELTPVSDETWHTNLLTPGIHKLRAFYSGDANYAPSASGTYWQAICSCVPDSGALRITTTSLPDGVVGQPYEAQLEAVGGTPPYSWSLADGVLPPGLSLASDGKITGTPTASGRWKLPGRPGSGTQLALQVKPALRGSGQARRGGEARLRRARPAKKKGG